MKKNVKTKNSTMTHQSILDRRKKTVLEQRKEALHKLIDELTEADYVETNTKLADLTGDKPTLVHQIIIEKKGNILVISKHAIRFDDYDDDDDD